jgi:putative hydrolase of the HAD superfamily
LLEQLHARGYPLALVADGPAATFRNIFAQHDLARLFDVLAISEQVGSEKPAAPIFHHALARLNISPQEYARVVMIGNNLARDVKGANALGIISVWLDWAPRRSKMPQDETERPRYTIHAPLEALTLLETLARL